MSSNGRGACGESIPIHRSEVARSKREDLQAPGRRVPRPAGRRHSGRLLQGVRCACRTGTTCATSTPVIGFPRGAGGSPMILGSGLCPSELWTGVQRGVPSGHRAERDRDRCAPALHTIACARPLSTAQRAEETHARGIIGSVTCEGTCHRGESSGWLAAVQSLWPVPRPCWDYGQSVGNCCWKSLRRMR